MTDRGRGGVASFVDERMQRIPSVSPLPVEVLHASWHSSAKALASHVEHGSANGAIRPNSLAQTNNHKWGM